MDMENIMKCNNCGCDIVLTTKNSGSPRLMVQKISKIECPHCGEIHDVEVPFGTVVEKPESASTFRCG